MLKNPPARYCINVHSLFHNVLEVVAEVSVESVLVDGSVDHLVSCMDVPYSRDEQHCSEGTLPPEPLTHTQILQQHHAVVNQSENIFIIAITPQLIINIFF